MYAIPKPIQRKNIALKTSVEIEANPISDTIKIVAPKAATWWKLKCDSIYLDEKHPIK